MQELCDNLEEYFNNFSNRFDNSNMTNDQKENLIKWHVKHNEITISQVDNWMQKAHLTPKIFRKVFNGEIFFRFK